MAELELLRFLPIEVAGPSDEARARARGRLLRHIRRAPRARRRRLLLVAAGLATAGAIAALLGVGSHGNGNAAAARVLRKIATVARTQAPPKPSRPGTSATRSPSSRT